MDAKDKLSRGAILVLAGAVLYIVGRFFIEGNKGLVIGVIGRCVVLCALVLHWSQNFRKRK